MDAASLLTDAERAFRGGDVLRAERLLKRVLSTAPASAKANELLGYVLGNRGDIEGARRRLEIATRRPGASPEAWYYLGTCLLKQGAYREAVEAIGKALSVGGDFFEGLHDLGLAQCQQGEALAAVESYDRAIALHPDSFEARYNRGRALDTLRRHEEALRDYDAALAVKPDSAAAWTNRGAALHDLDRFEEAVASFDRALALAPAHTEAWSGRGLALHDLQRHAEALACFAKEATLAPGHADLEWRESFTHLMLGDFETGWRKYEARWRHSRAEPRRHSHIAPWTGAEDLAGKRILAWAEQGHGDTIQFCRYAEQLTREGAEVILEVQPGLRSLLGSLAGVHVIGQGEPLPPCDFQVPLMSLPLAFGTRRETIPARIPYLAIEREEVERWSARLGACARRPRIAIACSGSRIHRNDARRSIPLERFAALEGDAETFLVQKDLRDADAQWLRKSGSAMRWLGAEIEFRDCAAIVANLDVVVTVDTALAHVAGALGRPVWILIPAAPDWRWLAEGDRSPWYPTARLFRQSRIGDWDDVLASVGDALRTWSPSA